jgi:cell division transport system permease protein
MLRDFSQRAARHRQAAASSFSIVWQTPFSSIVTIAVIAVALTLPTLFWIVSNNLKSVAAYDQHNAHIALYLKRQATPEEMNATLLKVRGVAGVKEALLKTPEQGLQEFVKQEGMQEVVQYLPENPLPGTIDLIPLAVDDKPLEISRLISTLKALPLVEQVKVDGEWIQRLNALMSLIHILSHSAMCLLSVAVVLVIGNTLRLAFHYRQEELTVLKLIGATDGYILRPFLYLGVWYGVLGALGAILLVTIFLYHLGIAVQTFASLYQVSYTFIGLTIQQSYLLILFSAMLGMIAAHAFVRTRLFTLNA